MRRAFAFVTGLGIGLGTMYLLDPQLCTRRRALLRHRAVRLRENAADALRRHGIDFGNRVRGSVAEARRALVPDHPTDALVVERIRAKLGHHTTHPRAIDVEVHHGRVTLAGPILADEVHAVLRAAGTTPGVHEVENQLEPHEREDDHPLLRGGREPDHGEGATRRNAVGVLAGAAGVLAAVAGAREIVRRTGIRPAPVR